MQTVIVRPGSLKWVAGLVSSVVFEEVQWAEARTRVIAVAGIVDFEAVVVQRLR